MAKQTPQTKKVAKPRKKSHLAVSHGIATIRATFNNTIVTITNPAGKVIAWSSAGKVGYKGSKKSSAYAGTVVGQDAGNLAFQEGMSEVDVRIKGPGAGRESAVRGLQAAGLNIFTIEDVTPVQHNGCRPPKRRRV